MNSSPAVRIACCVVSHHVAPAQAGAQFDVRGPHRNLGPGLAEGQPVLSLPKGRDDIAVGEFDLLHVAHTAHAAMTVKT